MIGPARPAKAIVTRIVDEGTRAQDPTDKAGLGKRKRVTYSSKGKIEVAKRKTDVRSEFEGDKVENV